ncbi:hypothetical protein L2E82_44513 [Cichorium intybus]|uniref:Uncharacterized protein n=1 Tax=Cichorium intybus TaxID=13427 RepID=A0ACB8ZQB6_CICIN|nr:hypothetical protein L2E82_44513 [Cichorium intybus]
MVSSCFSLPTKWSLSIFRRLLQKTLSSGIIIAGELGFVQPVTEGEALPSSATDLGFAKPNIQTSTLPSSTLVSSSLLGKPWERLERIELMELVSTNKEVVGGGREGA